LKYQRDAFASDRFKNDITAPLMKMKLYIPVLLGSIRVGRQSVHVANLVFNRLGDHTNVRTELLDLADYPFPALEYRMDQSKDPPTGLAEFSNNLIRANGILIVAPEYKNGYPGSLKNALDYLEAGAFRYTPIGICTVSSGGFGGLYCLSQLRMVCSALGGIAIPGMFSVSWVQDAFDRNGTY
jgi:NAD(P)H-dependent FMN reductase